MSDRIRRIVTGHDTAGLAVVLSDEQVSIVDFSGVSGWTAGSAVVWTTGAVPADNATDLVGSERPTGATFNGGSVLRVIQFGPGFVSPMHRQDSHRSSIILAAASRSILTSMQAF